MLVEDAIKVLKEQPKYLIENNCLVGEVSEIVAALDLAISALERDRPKHVEMSEWKGCRNTRYKCPGCGKNARNDETYCHKCGQHIVFPMIDFTPYAEGKKQKVIVTWPDEVFFEVPLPEPPKED